MNRNSPLVYAAAQLIRWILLPIAKRKYKNKEIWLVSERGTDARDNGYHMFCYLRKQHPEVEAWYIITRDSVDLKRIADLGNIAFTGSLNHWMLYIVASKILTAFEPIVPSANKRFAQYVIEKNDQKVIFLQHGILGTNVSCYHQEQAKYDLFICGAKPEYDFVTNNFNYTHGEVRYTGLARFDALHNFTTKKQICIMPTWRKWLATASEKEVANSEYAKRWNHLINNQRLADIAEKHDVEIVFFLHQELQKYIGLFTSQNRRIIIGDWHKYNVQPLLMEASMLITDFSSVHFDFAYMKKPVLYYQFDEGKFYSEHNQRGFFDYSLMGFGEKVNDEDKLLDLIDECAANDFKLTQVYEQRIEGFFPLHDTCNCERIYQEIVNTFDR